MIDREIDEALEKIAQTPYELEPALLGRVAGSIKSSSPIRATPVSRSSSTGSTAMRRRVSTRSPATGLPAEDRPMRQLGGSLVIIVVCLGALWAAGLIRPF